MNGERLTRREFLTVTALASGAVAFGVALPGTTRAAAALGPQTDPTSIGLWLRVGRDSRIVFVNPHAEMGQGTWSTLAMVFVDEFGGDWDSTDIQAGGVDPAFRLNPYVDEVFTAGSSSIAFGYAPVRKAAAIARAMFLNAAAVRLGVGTGQLSLSGSAVHGPGGARIPIGELVDEVAQMTPPAEAPLKGDTELRLVGRGVPAREVPDKVTGATIFGIDYHEPGMLVSTVKASPVHGGRVIRSNADQVRRLPGVIAVIEVPHGLAVVADTFWRAKKAVDALEIEFDSGGAEDVDDEWFYATHAAAVRREDGAVGYDDGDARAWLAASDGVHESVYYVPWLAHATMEPMSCSARVTTDRADLWLGTQGIEYATLEVAKATGLEPGQVHIHNLMMGGGFGRRYEADVPVQAAIIAKALLGRTVKLIWTREEDFAQDFCRPASMVLMRASLGADGLPAALLTRVSAPAIAAHNPGFAKFAKPVDLTAIDGFVNILYELPRKRFEWVQTESHLKIGWWRSVGNSNNAFAKECFVDELAEEAGIDAIEYRLRMLQGDKHANTRRLLTELARAANWGCAPAGRFQGVALHDTFGTIVGEVVELSVEEREIKVHRITCAYDCGSIVNPRAVDAQLCGSILWGLSAVLMGEMNVARGQFMNRNFHEYPVQRMAQAPAIEAFPVLRGGPPSGVGEPGVPPVMPAAANALYRATGKRYRRLPLSRHGFATG